MAVVAFTICGSAAILFFDEKVIHDLSKEESPFNKIAMPPRKVSGGYYMDGGSVFVRLIDGNGVIYDLAFPYNHRSGGYPAAYYGALDGTSRAAKPFRDPIRARIIALELMDTYGGESQSTKEAHDYLSGRYRSLIGRFERDGIRGVFGGQ